MANVKINDLAVIADPASTDVLPIVDVTLDTTNKISIADILKTVPAGTASAASIAFEGDSNTGIYHPGSEQIGFTTSGSEAVRIDSAGNVGIGTTNPNNLLKVYGGRIEVQTDTSLSATDSSVFNIKTGSTGGSLFTIRAENTADNNSNWEIKTNTNEQLKFTVGASESMRIDSSGRLLVGTSSAITTANATLLQLADSAGARIILGRNNQNVSAGNRIGQIDFLSNATDGTYDTCATIRCESDDSFTDDSKPSILKFSTTASGAVSSTDRMTIKSNGKVGIGTTDPSELLDVRGSSDPQLKVSATNTGTNSAGLLIENQGQRNWQIWADRTSDQLRIGNNSRATTNLAIDNLGRLGIGTSSPDELLHIEGDVAEFKGTNTNPIEVSAGTEQIFKFGIEGQKNNVYGPAGSIIFRQDGTWSSVEPNFKPTRIELCTQDDATTDTSETPRLVVDQDGYVGIGTTSPQSLFDVVSPNSNTTETIAEFGNQTIAGGLQIETNGNLDWGFNARNSRNLTFSTNQDEAARIDSSGRLLVGTSNPIATPASLGFAGLQVASTGTASSATNSRFSNNAAAPFYEFAKSRGTSVGTQAVVGENDQLGTIVFAGSSGSAFVESARIRAQVDADPDPNDDGQAENGMPGRLVFSTTGSGASSPTERMRITSTGRVGIDATDPQAALDINAAASTSPFIASIDGSEAARIDSSGRLLVGTSSSLGNVGGAEPVLQIADNSVNAAFCFARFTTNSSGPSVILAKAKSATIGTFTSVQDSDELGKVVFAGADGTNATSIGAEIKAVARPTIATGSIPTRLEIGLTKSGETSPTGRIRLEPTGNSKFYVDSGNIFEIRRGGTSSTQEAISLYNGSTGFNTGSLAFTVRGDGDCENANNAYTGISDVKLKENIVDAESQWDDIRALRVRKYNLKGELGYSTHTQIGLVAQEVELISPGLVGEGTDIDGEGNDLGTVTKSVNYSVLYMKAVKALQEAMERIETLEQRLTDAGI